MNCGDCAKLLFLARFADARAAGRALHMRLSLVCVYVRESGRLLWLDGAKPLPPSPKCNLIKPQDEAPRSASTPASFEY